MKTYKYISSLTGVVIIVWLITSQLTLAQSTNQVDLLWEADTYRPPFYRGHSQASPESEVKVVADAHFYNSRGVAIADSQLDFQWEKDARRISSFSGPGGRELVFTADVAGLAHEIKVTITSPDGTSLTRKILIPVDEPQIRLYEDNPLIGTIYGRAIAEPLVLNQSEITLIAEPYFFSADQIKAKRLQFAWFLNNKATTLDQARPNRIILLTPENNAGENKLQLNISSLDKILQEASASLTIKFNQANFNF